MDVPKTIGDRFNGWRRSGRLFLECLAVIGSLASVVGVILTIPTGEPLIRTVSLACLGLFGVLGVAMGFWLHWRSLRRSCYAETHFYTHHVIHFIRDKLAQIERLRLDGVSLQLQTKEAVTTILDAICRTFGIITGAHCRACIKVLSEPSMLPGQAISREQMCALGEVRVFCRDSLSEANPHNDEPSKLSCNPRFLDLFKDGNKRFYCCQDCHDRNQHCTDSIEKYPQGLPYQSVFVWPIRLPAYVFSGEGGEKPTQKMVGFLIVACSRRRAFNIRWDFEIGALFADALYGFLTRCHVRYYGDPSNKADESEPKPHPAVSTVQAPAQTRRRA